MSSRVRVLATVVVAAGLIGVAGCSGPSIEGIDPALALSSGDASDIGTRKIGKPYKVGGRWYTPAHDEDYDKVGMASWYGPGFHGKRTANGERFNQNALTAAHTTLPLPSYVRVTNVKNGKSVVVRVNDRGPFSKRRIIDVSKRTAKELEFIRAGKAKVRVEYLGPAPLKGGDKETRRFAKAQAKANGTRVASAQAPKGGGFFGFGRKKDDDGADVRVRLASVEPAREASEDEAQDGAPQAALVALQAPRSTGLPGVGDRDELAPVRVMAMPGAAPTADTPQPRGATVSAEPILPTSPAYAAVRQDGGTVSPPIKTAPSETLTAYAATETSGAIDAVIAMNEPEPKAQTPQAPLVEPSTAPEDRFHGAHDLFAASENAGLFRPTPE